MPDQTHQYEYENRPYEVGEVASDEWLARERERQLNSLARGAAKALMAQPDYRPPTLDEILVTLLRDMRAIPDFGQRLLEERRERKRRALFDSAPLSDQPATDLLRRYLTAVGRLKDLQLVADLLQAVARFERTPRIPNGPEDIYELSRHMRAQTEVLTDHADIKSWRAAGESYTVIAERLDGYSSFDPLTRTHRPGVTAADVRVIETMRGKSLKPESAGERDERRYDLREQIRHRHRAGESLRDLAAEFGVGKSTVQRWCEE